MKRLDGRLHGGRAPVRAARDRFATGRLVAAALGGAAGAGAIALHFHFHPPEPFLSTTPHYAAAAVCGLFAGWRVLGLGLGRGARTSAMLGLTSAVAATLLFCLMAGVKAVLDMYAYGSFSTVMELFDFLLRRSITTAHEVAASPALPAAAAAALVIGVLAERTRRAVDETDLPKA